MKFRRLACILFLTPSGCTQDAAVAESIGFGSGGADEGVGGPGGSDASDGTQEGDDATDTADAADTTDATDTTVGDTSDGDGPKLDVGDPGGPSNSCAPGASSFIYLLSTDVERRFPTTSLYRFDPETFEAESLGALDCDDVTPMAMTIDR